MDNLNVILGAVGLVFLFIAGGVAIVVDEACQKAKLDLKKQRTVNILGLWFCFFLVGGWLLAFIGGVLL